MRVWEMVLVAVSFNGVNQHIRTWYGPTWAQGVPFTVGCWFKTPSLAQGAFFGGQVSATAARFGLLLADSGGTLRCQLNFFDDGNAGSSRIGDTVVNDNVWRHAAIVRDPIADTINLYLNGVLEAAASGSDDTTGTCTLTARDFALGSLHTGATSWSIWLTCNIEDFAVWDSALTLPQILTLANNPQLRAPAVEVAHLLRYWPLSGVSAFPLPAQNPMFSAGPTAWPAWGLPKAIAAQRGVT